MPKPALVISFAVPCDLFPEYISIYLNCITVNNKTHLMYMINETVNRHCCATLNGDSFSSTNEKQLKCINKLHKKNTSIDLYVAFVKRSPSHIINTGSKQILASVRFKLCCEQEQTNDNVTSL